MNDYITNHLYVHDNRQQIIQFNHPTCKATFQSLPKIYGRKKKGKPLFIAKLRQQNKKVQQSKKVEQVKEQNNKRIESRLYDPEIAQKLSKPKNHRCDKKNCPCHCLSDDTFDINKIKLRKRTRQKDRFYTQQQQKISSRKYSTRTSNKVILPPMKKFNLDDLQSSHKVSFKKIDSSRIDIQSGLSRLIQTKKNKSQNELILGVKNRKSNIVEKLQRINLQKQQSKQSDYSEKYIQNRNSMQEKKIQKNQKNRKFRRLTQMKDQSSQIGTSSISYHKQDNEDQSQSQDILKKRTQLDRKQKFRTQPNERLKNGIALSSNIFRSIQQQNTQFHRYQKKFEKDKMYQKRRSLISSKMSYSCFKVPQQKDYIKFLASYNPLDSQLNMKELIKSQNFNVIKENNGVYFGQVNQQGNKSGRGITISQKQIFQGIYQNNVKISGYERVLDSVFKGSYINGLRSGKGFLKLVNGQTFQGTWKNGKKNGFIRWKSPSGDSCQGQWKDDKQHGKGIFKHKMSTYEGYFQNFLKHGQGQESFINGDYYKGLYRNGKPQGKGFYKWNNNTTYDGYFQNGMRCGYGKMVENDGTIYEGNFKEDFKHGFAKQTYKSGQKFQGIFQEGKRKNGRLYNSDGLQIEIIQK